MIKYRPYQSDFIKKVLSAFGSGEKKICVVAPCGSGKTVLFAGMAEATQKNGKTVWFLVHRKELLDQTVDTFVRFGIELRTIQIGMVTTVANHLDSYPKPDMIIFDECHFSAARTWQKIVETYPDCYYIGLTATPCRLDGKPLKGTYDYMIQGVTAKELVKQGYLAPYKYYAPSVADLSALKRKGRDFDSKQAEELLSTRAVFGDVIKHYRKYADGKQAICYCSSINHSEKMAEQFVQAGINAVHFDGNTPKKQRDEIIEQFRKGEIRVLCNVDLISVGFDCPDCECCILLRPTMSLALYIQQSMRCMRPKEGKTAIILDHVNNYTRFGLPDDDREWSLDSVPKKKPDYGEDGKLLIRQCPVCFGTYKANGTKKCPYCGSTEKLTAQEIKNIKEIHLEEIKEATRKKAETAVKDITNPDDCRTMAELFALAKKKGYKSGWAYLQGKKRGLIK
jgi:superfamily II DNA or RNA helicase